MEEVPAPVEVWHNVEAAGIVKRQLHFKDFRGFTVTSWPLWYETRLTTTVDINCI